LLGLSELQDIALQNYESQLTVSIAESELSSKVAKEYARILRTTLDWIIRNAAADSAQNVDWSK